MHSFRSYGSVLSESPSRVTKQVSISVVGLSFAWSQNSNSAKPLPSSPPLSLSPFFFVFLFHLSSSLNQPCLEAYFWAIRDKD